MTESLLLVAGLICIMLPIFLFRKNSKEKEDSNPSQNTVIPTVPRVSPPPLPPRNNQTQQTAHPARQVLDYPKCPIDRCRNEPGKPQVVFWDSVKKCYTCCHGHHFTGRE